MNNSKYFLLVDDDLVMTYVNIITIQNYYEGAKIVDFISSKKALAFLRKQAKDNKEGPFVIFLDINMPELNGFEFLDKIKSFKDGLLKDTKIYLLTSSLDSRDKSKAEKYSMVNGYLGKPLKEEVLQSILN